MGVETLVIGGLLSAVGTGVQTIGAMKAADAQKEQIAIQQRQEEQRKKAMELDARRRQMEVIRQAQRARAMALTTATSQGAQYGSALPGAYGGIAGATGVNSLGINQNLEIGRNMFALNSQLSSARMDAADAGTFSSIGSGLSSLGSNVFSSAQSLNRLSQNFNTGAVWDGNMRGIY